MQTYSPWAGANCTSRDADPNDWDTDVASMRGIHRRYEYQRAYALCAGCPLIQACAAEGAEAGDVGTIRAGIPLRNRIFASRQTQADKKALRDIAAGQNPQKVSRRLMLRSQPQKELVTA